MGADSHVEVTVPSPLAKSAYQVGRWHPPHASVGHLYAFGNTEERYHTLILGVRAKGHKRDGPFNHKTGRDWARKHSGAYAHALSQGARVTPLIVETTGAISLRSLRFVAHLAHHARGKNARGGTKYGKSRMSAKSFYAHHTQRLSMATAHGDASSRVNLARWAQLRSRPPLRERWPKWPRSAMLV